MDNVRGGRPKRWALNCLFFLCFLILLGSVPAQVAQIITNNWQVHFCLALAITLGTGIFSGLQVHKGLQVRSRKEPWEYWLTTLGMIGLGLAMAASLFFLPELQKGLGMKIMATSQPKLALIVVVTSVLTPIATFCCTSSFGFAPGFSRKL